MPINREPRVEMRCQWPRSELLTPSVRYVAPGQLWYDGVCPWLHSPKIMLCRQFSLRDRADTILAAVVTLDLYRIPCTTTTNHSMSLSRILNGDELDMIPSLRTSYP